MKHTNFSVILEIKTDHPSDSKKKKKKKKKKDNQPNTERCRFG